MARHITNNRDRKSRKYIAKHLELAHDVREARKPEPDKISRHREASQYIRQHGAP